MQCGKWTDCRNLKPEAGIVPRTKAGWWWLEPRGQQWRSKGVEIFLMYLEESIGHVDRIENMEVEQKGRSQGKLVNQKKDSSTWTFYCNSQSVLSIENLICICPLFSVRLYCERWKWSFIIFLKLIWDKAHVHMFVSCLCFLFVDDVFSYWYVRPDHQSPGSPLSPMDFLAPFFSYIPENSCSVFFFAFISSILFSCPIPTLPSFCSQPSSLLSTSIPRWALLFT